MSDTRAPQHPAITAAALIARLLEIGEVYSAKNASRVLATMAAPAAQQRVKPFSVLAYLRSDDDLRAYVAEHVRYALAVPVAQQPAPDMAEYWQRRAECAEESEQRILDSIAAQQPAEPLTDEQWLDLASRHANADWNSEQPDGYLNAVKALVRDALAHPPAADNRPETQDHPAAVSGKEKK